MNEVMEYAEIKPWSVMMLMGFWLGLFALTFLVMAESDYKSAPILGGVVVTVDFMMKSSGLEVDTVQQKLKKPVKDMKYLDEFFKDKRIK